MTLTPHDDAKRLNTPPLQGRGLSAGYLDTLGGHDRDMRRDAALGALGFTVIHVTNNDVMRNLDGVCSAIRAALDQTADRWDRPHPNPSPEGEGK